jgi:hypothetical protein
MAAATPDEPEIVAFHVQNARPNSFNLTLQADIGHGYASAIHKNQSAASIRRMSWPSQGGPDLSYVAVSRHRHAARHRRYVRRPPGKK